MSIQNSQNKLHRQIKVIKYLINKLIKLNLENRSRVINELNVPYEYEDYRIEQFGYIDNTLKSIFFSACSLSNVQIVAHEMKKCQIEMEDSFIFENQRAYFTFNAIVKLSAIFEYTRNQFENKLSTQNYFKNLKDTYPDLGISYDLLRVFRNTLHTNGLWQKIGCKKSHLSFKNKCHKFQYSLNGEETTLYCGDSFEYTHWFLYTIIRDSLMLHTEMALDNPEAKIRKIKNTENGAVVKTGFTADQLLELSKRKTQE